MHHKEILGFWGKLERSWKGRWTTEKGNLDGGRLAKRTEKENEGQWELAKGGVPSGRKGRHEKLIKKG